MELVLDDGPESFDAVEAARVGHLFQRLEVLGHERLRGGRGVSSVAVVE